MKEQRKTLKELLNENALGVIGTFIRDQISRAHPGCDTDYKFRPALNRISMGYWAPEPCRDLCLMIDSSGSVNPQLFKAIGEGAREVFKANLGDGQRRDYAVVNFSDKTLFSDWVPKTQYEQLEAVIGAYQGGGTTLDPKIVAQLSEGNRRFATLIVTDGEMQNADRVIPTLHGMTKQGNKMGVIYVGPNGIPYSVKQMGEFANIFCVTDGDKLKATMRDYAKTALKQE